MIVIEVLQIRGKTMKSYYGLNRRILFAICVFFVAGTLAFSKGIKLFGKVTDADDKKVKKAIIRLLDMSGEEVGEEKTGGNGKYSFNKLEPGEYTLKASHDEKGIIWPKSISPFHIGLINLNIKNKDLTKISDDIYDNLEKNNFDVLYDDTSERPGEKFANMDLIGVPIQIILGEKSFKENCFELKNRNTNILHTCEIGKLKNISEILKKFNL